MKASYLHLGLSPCLLLVGLCLAESPAFADYTVTGKFLYEDRSFDKNGFTGAIDLRPIRYADVQIVAGSTVLVTGATAADGSFSILVPGSTAQSIRAVCVASSTATSGLLMEIRYPYSDYSFGGLYSFASSAINSSGSGTVTVGTWTARSNDDLGRVFNIWDVVYDGMEFVASPNMNGSFPAKKLTLLWASGGSTASFYGSGTNRFAHVGSRSGYDDTVIAQEFGHFVADAFSKLESTPLTPVVSPYQLSLFADPNQDIRAAWAEGLSIFIGCSIRKIKGYPRPDVYVVTDGTNSFFSVELESLTSNPALPSKKGSTNALAVAAALWDIADGSDSDDATPGVDDDHLQRSFSDIWRVLTVYMPSVTAPGMSAEIFWEGWFSTTINNGSPAEMQEIFATLNGLEFITDTQEADDTVGVARIVTPAPLSLTNGQRVTINEIDVGTAPTIELFNSGDTDANLAGWTITASRANTVSALLVIPPYRLKPGSFVVLVGGKGANTSSVLYFDSPVPIPWANGTEGACALRDINGVGQDFVRWGDSKEFPPGGTAFVGSNPPALTTGNSLGRDYRGTDTNSGSDWAFQNPTLGTFNASGQEKHHTFYPAGDVDFVAFNAVAGRTYVLETLNLTCGADTILELLAADGATGLTSNDDRGPTKASRIVWPAPSNGTYYLRSRRYDGPVNFARYGAYDLRIIESPISLPAPAAEILTVSKPGQGGNFQTISDALAAAGNGDTVQIMDSDSYPESLAITGKSVTLKAAAGRTPTLDGRGRSESATVLLTSAKTVRIEGLTILAGLRGIIVNNGVSATIAKSTVSNASDPYGAGYGIFVTGSSANASISNSRVNNNGQVGIVVSSGATASVLSTKVDNNGGVGINAASGATVKIINSVLRNNYDGVSIGDSGTNAAIVHCTIVKNARAGVGVFTKASARVANTIATGNPTADVGGDGSAASLVVKNSVVTKGGYAGKDGNIDSDPKFVDSATDDYHLQSGSPSIDKAGSDPDQPVTDIEGVPRSLDGNNDGASAPDMGAYEYVAATILTSLGVFPQIAVGGPAGAEYRTAIFGMNTGSQAVIVNASLTRSDGAPLPVNIANGSGSSFNLVILPGGTVRLETSVSGGTLAGYAKLSSNLPIGGSALFKTVNVGDQLNPVLVEAGVGLSRPTKAFTVYVDNLNNAFSGYAVANFGTAPASLALKLRDKSGNQIDSTQVTLPAGQHFARFAYQDFPKTAPDGFEGSIEFTSDQDVAAVALRYDNPGDIQDKVYSTIPVLVDEAATVLYFPQVADGGGYRTNFILVNPNAQATTASLEFCDNDGKPLSLPIGGVASTTYEMAVAAKGVARFVTDGTSAGVRVGWVKVTSPVALGGSSIFQTVARGRITSEAGVASSPLATHFTTYVESLGYAESGLAIANPNSGEVTITLNLRDSDGSIVTSRSFRLPSKGHVASFFSGVNQWFPGYEDFEGTLEVLASAPVSGVALRYDNYAASVFATLPVVVIP